MNNFVLLHQWVMVGLFYLQPNKATNHHHLYFVFAHYLGDIYIKHELFVLLSCIIMECDAYIQIFVILHGIYSYVDSLVYHYLPSTIVDISLKINFYFNLNSGNGIGSVSVCSCSGCGRRCGRGCAAGRECKHEPVQLQLERQGETLP